MLSVAAETELGELALDVALEVAAGECLALAGPSGAGKSSVLRIAAGLSRPRAGRGAACGERVSLYVDGRIEHGIVGKKQVGSPGAARRCAFC